MTAPIRANIAHMHAPSPDAIQSRQREMLANPNIDIAAVVARQKPLGRAAGDPVHILTRHGHTSVIEDRHDMLAHLETVIGPELLSGTDAASAGSIDANASEIYSRRREEAAKGQPTGDRRQHADDHPTTAAQLDPDAVYRRRQQAQGNES